MSSFDPGIVHLTGGVAGLTGTIILKPRKGRFENPEEFEAHNLPFVVSPGSMPKIPKELAKLIEIMRH